MAERENWASWAVISTASSMLFVPGNRPERFEKAVSAGPDVVIVDLEDAVPEADKAMARANVRNWVADAQSTVVRINAAGSPWYEEDLRAVISAGCPVMVPKAEDPRTLAALTARLAPGVGVVPLVETAVGVLAAPGLCLVPGVIRPAFGNVDLATELGVAPGDHDALRHARSLLVLAAAAAGIASPVDGVTTELDGEAVLLADTRHAVTLGLWGKMCVHPRQIALVHAALAPTEQQLAWARRVVDTAEGHAGSGGAISVDGQMVDRPVVERARRLLDRAQGRPRTRSGGRP